MRLNTPLAVAVAVLLGTACSTSPPKPEGLDTVRNKLSRLQTDPQLASRAPVAMKEAELAVRVAEEPHKDPALAKHLVTIADREVDIAGARAQTSLLEDLRKMLSDQQQTARLDARTREADRARADANTARIDAGVARTDAATARADADAAQNQTDLARSQTEAAKAHSDELLRQLSDLNAKTTERGLVVTLGDVLFATGQSDLKGGAQNNLGKLAAFLNKYPDSTVAIEGHTDNVGSDDSNQGLSQRRAESVKSYLMSHGVGSTRLSATGKGEGAPIAGNDSATGRQQNRRVEVIIANNAVSTAAAVSLR